MAVKFGKTAGEIWMERLTAALLTGVTLFAHAFVFALLAYRADRRIVAVAVPFLCFLAWQTVSKICTGQPFSRRLFLDDRTSRELFDVIFTTLCALNVAFFLYFVFS